MLKMQLLEIILKKETFIMDANMMFAWMRWMSRIHNRNRQSQTKMVPHLQRRKKKMD
ncbi:hypothetical protein Gogos_009433, partial [Gossypium gossypioides]|nr:hypothetical protein [Gossypium gossypioides]